MQQRERSDAVQTPSQGQMGQRSFVLVLATDEEVVNVLQSFAEQHAIGAAQMTAIGAFRDAELSYLRIPVQEQVEVAAFIGDVAVAPSGDPVLHIHVVVGRRDGTAMAGHLQATYVRPTLEVILTESPVYLRKTKDPNSGLALIDSNASQ